MQWLMLQQERPEDYVIATGIQYSVREFVNAAARVLDMRIHWEGEGVEERGYWETGNARKLIVSIDPDYFRPAEVETLLGDPTKAKSVLGWTPTTTFEELVKEMVQEDFKLAKRDELIKIHGYKTMDYHE